MVGRCSDSQPAGLSPNYISQNPFLRGLRCVAAGAFCPRFGRREGSGHYPSQDIQLAVVSVPSPVPAGELKIASLSLAPCPTLPPSWKVVAEGSPVRSLRPQQMQRSQPRRHFSGLACPASAAAKGCLPQPPASVHLATHARPQGSWPPNPLSRPSFSRPHTMVCGPAPLIYPLFYYVVSNRISLTDMNPEGI